MSLGISFVRFALLAAALFATTAPTDATASSLRRAEDTHAVLDRNLITAEKALVAYVHSAADGTDVQEFEGYLTTAHFLTGDVLHLTFPNGLSRRIINLPPLDDLPSSGGAKQMVMVMGKLIDGGWTIDAMDNMPKTIISDKDESMQTRAGATQTLTVLVVRVMADDATTTATAAELSDDIFGTGTADQLSVKEGYESCSFGKVVLNPASWSGTGSTTIGTGSEVGTTTVTVSANATNMDISTFEGVVTLAINNQFGVQNPGQLADFVLYCVPPGVKNGMQTNWAYAWSLTGNNQPFYWHSVYSDGNCPSHSTVMHEIGHNMNLDHASNENGSEEYGDETGMMGYSYSDQDAPKKCFNGAKSWFLGWYMDRHLTFTPATTNCMQEVTLVGLAEYNNAGTNDIVIVKIVEPTQQRGFYAMFNRAIGINEDTGGYLGEGKDQVLITRQDDHTKSTTDTEFSYLLAGLNQGDSYMITDFDGTGLDLTITVNSLSTSNAAPDRSTIAIKLGSCTENPSSMPSRAPSSVPSSDPSSDPSSTPSKAPSSVPSSSPSSDPSSTPSKAPSSVPSSAPSSDPSSAPSAAPSSVPSSPPSSDPSSTPSKAPSSVPSGAPSSVLSSAPSKAPSSVPSSAPSVDPSSMPSISPSGKPSAEDVTSKPSSTPSAAPSSVPSKSSKPSSTPSRAPSSVPSRAPSVDPSSMPSISPSSMPSRAPSSVPSSAPSSDPSSTPSKAPSSVPSSPPSSDPSSTPSKAPSSVPSGAPSSDPSSMPSTSPSDQPTSKPSSAPSMSSRPSSTPSTSPSSVPSGAPSSVPSSMPSISPSKLPSSNPSVLPSTLPSASPSMMPSFHPSLGPSSHPSVSAAPSALPSSRPSKSPTKSPTPIPRPPPTRPPTKLPSSRPSSVPSAMSAMPSITASGTPSALSSPSPSTVASSAPSMSPSNTESITPSTVPTISHSPSTMSSPGPSNLSSSTTPLSTPTPSPTSGPAPSPNPPTMSTTTFSISVCSDNCGDIAAAMVGSSGIEMSFVEAIYPDDSAMVSASFTTDAGSCAETCSADDMRRLQDDNEDEQNFHTEIVTVVIDGPVETISGEDLTQNMQTNQNAIEQALIASGIDASIDFDAITDITSTFVNFPSTAPSQIPSAFPFAAPSQSPSRILLSGRSKSSKSAVSSGSETAKSESGGSMAGSKSAKSAVSLGSKSSKSTASGEWSI